VWRAGSGVIVRDRLQLKIFHVGDILCRLVSPPAQRARESCGAADRVTLTERHGAPAVTTRGAVFRL
jgi:hypothetical protein